MAGKVIHAVTVAQTLKLMKGQLAYLEDKGYETKALSSKGDYIKDYEQAEGVKVLNVEMEREISLLKDLSSLIACVKLFYKEKPDIVNAGTPKAALIAMLAAFITGVPIRIYNVLGLRLETTTGLKRLILLTAEKITATAATHILSVSPSLSEQLVSYGIAAPEKIKVLGNGSLNGFNLADFELDDERRMETDSLKKELGLSKDHLVVGFMGRITRDKGVAETVAAFLGLSRRYPQLRLLVVGDFEEGDPVDEKTKQEILDNQSIILVPYQKDPIPYFHMMDIFLFLTKREGFGNVSIEASLAGKPVIVSDVTGARDTVSDWETGLLVNPQNGAEVINRLELLINDKALRQRLGANGKVHAEANYSNEAIWMELEHFYHELLLQQTGALQRII
ncbi:glycosyltransferase involved in cell wall biosynthesis [Planomicrobium koreense]|uniref:Glycosyltransferase involved in cell wall biosynthesis n=1 Tax=Planococcus koreensis TaxID=112331 RepID=A0A7W8FRQ3_9BACL|nr:glycosyltransferase family 4 protein [Planococcus koreensis]MBB5179243.1 glycosyltransferase involved in cell wall biosynthesis [Planococcus koreensis]